MRPDDILDVIGNTKDEYVKEAKAKVKVKRFPTWAKALSAAACIVLVIGIGASVFFGSMGGSAGGGSGSSSDLVYMNYEGPILPMTLSKENSNITAERNVDFDFSPYKSYEESFDDGNGETYTYTQYDTEAIVTDSYLLTNSSAEDITVTAYYPFAGTLSNSEKYPVITVNGETAESTLNFGPYSGGFMGVWGGKNEENGTENLDPLSSFTGYEKILTGDDYMASAFDEFPSLNQTVYVYRMHDYVFSQDETATNPTLQMSFYIDYDKTTVLTYGINGATNDSETGYCARHNGAIEYRPNASPEFRYPRDAYIVIMGEDIGEYEIQGYRDGGCDKGEELDDLGCTITRYETTLGEFLYGIIEMQQTDFDADLLYGLAAELMMSYGPLGENFARYYFGDLDTLLSEVKIHGRVIYAAFDVTIPAGETAFVEAVMPLDASVDYIGDDKNREGYDMATVLGSNLNFTSQTASISNYEEIEIIAQNFGFDLIGGVDKVALDISQPHYWIEVTKKKAE